MKTIVLLIATLIASAQAFAAPVYYKGSQPIGISGEVTECFVEVEYQSDGLSAKVRSLVADPHGDGDLFGIGPVEPIYEASKAGYHFVANEDHEKVQELFLAAAAKKTSQSESLELTILDGNHTDSLQCKDLQVPQGAELASLKEKFDHFDDNTGEEDHDHDHSHH